MTRELNRSESRFKQTDIYRSINRLLIYQGVFREVCFENLDSILDIGCGEAPDIEYIIRNNKMRGIMVGLDIYSHKKWKDIMLHYDRVHFLVADAHYLPFRLEEFDFVFAKDLLHHIQKDQIRVIEEALRVVGNLGILRVIEANRYHINPILVLKNDKSHDHFTLKQIHKLKKCLSFGEFYGFELLPSFSTSMRDIIWNFFAIFFWFSTTWFIGRRFLFLYIKMKEKLMRNNLTYYVLSKKKVREYN
jgi:ubiquinone/menaquinone biosynthesis C-methylase UbiE